MELVAGGPQHVTPRSSSFFHLLVTSFCELLESIVHFFFAKDCSYRFLGFVVLFMKNVPPGRLRELCDDCEEYDWIYLHGEDRYPPGPLVLLSEVVGEDEIEDECHIETEDVGLELLCERHAARVVFLRFGGVNGDHGVSTTWTANSSVAILVTLPLRSLSSDVPTPKPMTIRPVNMTHRAPFAPPIPATNMMIDPKLAVTKQKNMPAFLPFQSAKREKPMAPTAHPR